MGWAAASAMPSQGPDNYAAKWAAEVFRSGGDGAYRIVTHAEAPICAFTHDQEMDTGSVTASAAVDAHEAIGSVERSYFDVHASFRAMRTELQARVGRQVAGDSPSPHVVGAAPRMGLAKIANARGAVCHSKVVGVPYTPGIVQFAEKVQARDPSVVGSQKHAYRTTIGHWLGRSEASNDHLR